jgi:hypothetical protein
MDTDEHYIQLLKGWNWNQRQIDAAMRANFCCEYCDRDLLASANDHHGFHVDHIWPVSKGGPPDEPWNLALACAFCNFTKGNRMLHGTFEPALDRAGAVRAVRQELVVLRKKKSSTLNDLRGHFRSELWLRNRPLPASPLCNSEGASEREGLV